MTNVLLSRVEALLTWIRDHQRGECRILSQGEDCRCPLCNADALVAEVTRLQAENENAPWKASYKAATERAIAAEAEVIRLQEENREAKAEVAELRESRDEIEANIIDSIRSNWFTQGGESQFGELESSDASGDDVVASILSVVRHTLATSEAALRDAQAQREDLLLRAESASRRLEVLGAIEASVPYRALMLRWARAYPGRATDPVDMLRWVWGRADLYDAEKVRAEKAEAALVKVSDVLRSGGGQEPQEKEPRDRSRDHVL